MTGFQQFTSFFTYRFPGKAALFLVLFSVAIRAHKDTLVEFLPHLLPCPGNSRTGNREIFFSGIEMVKFERIPTAIVPAKLAHTALVFERLLFQELSSFDDSSLQILPAVGLCSFVSPHIRIIR